MSAPCRVGRSCGVFPIPSSCEAMARGQRPRVAMHEPTRAHAAAQAYTARTTRMPRMVSASEPTTCEAIAIVPHRYSLRSSRVTISAENVENVVRPPRNPVVASNCISGLIIAWRVMISIAKPINNPPMRLALKVPSGSVGNTGLSMTPTPQRSQAPIAAPPPTARIPPQGIQRPFRANTARQSGRKSSANLGDEPQARQNRGSGHLRLLQRGSQLRDLAIDVAILWKWPARAPVPITRIAEISFHDVHDAVCPTSEPGFVLLHDSVRFFPLSFFEMTYRGSKCHGFPLCNHITSVRKL